LWCDEIICVLVWSKDRFGLDYIIICRILFLDHISVLGVRDLSFYALFWDLFKDHSAFGVLNILTIFADNWFLQDLLRNRKHVLVYLFWAKGVCIFILIIWEHKLIETLLKFLHFLKFYLFPRIHFLEYSLISNRAVDAFILVALSADLRFFPKHIIKAI